MSNKSKLWTALIAILAIAAAVYAMTAGKDTIETPVVTQPVAANLLEGRATCLPHKNQTGPQTLECALGLKTDAGTFYALDGSSLEPGALVTLNESERVRVRGITVPIEAISSDLWAKYDIIGVMKVEVVEKLK